MAADKAVDELLTAYHDVLPINPSVMKADMQIIRHVYSLKRFCRSDTDLYQQITAAEAAELENCANLYKLMQLISTLRVSSATCERSFSAMHRVYNYLRMTMSANLFSTLSSLYIEHDLSNNTDVHDVLARYVETGKCSFIR